MKYEAKTYKAKNRIALMGTGGGPSTSTEDVILDEVLNMIGRAGVGVAGVIDSDFLGIY